MMKGLEGSRPSAGPLLTEHVQGNALLQVPLGSYAVDTLLCLAETPVAPLHCVTCRAQQPVIQEHQRLLQVWALQLLQRLAQPLEPLHTTPQLRQTSQGRCRPA